MLGQIYVAISRVTNIKGLYLPSSFKKDATKANTEALKEYKRLRKAALFTKVLLPLSLPEALSVHGGVLILVKLQALACNFTEINTLPWVILLNVTSLMRQTTDIAYDKILSLNYLTRFKFTRVQINAKLPRFFLKCALINDLIYLCSFDCNFYTKRT